MAGDADTAYMGKGCKGVKGGSDGVGRKVPPQKSG